MFTDVVLLAITALAELCAMIDCTEMEDALRLDGCARQYRNPLDLLSEATTWMDVRVEVVCSLLRIGALSLLLKAKRTSDPTNKLAFCAPHGFITAIAPTEAAAQGSAQSAQSEGATVPTQ